MGASKLQVECAACGRQSQVLAEHAGRAFKCKACGAKVTVPALPGAAPAAPSPAEAPSPDPDAPPTRVEEGACVGCGARLRVHEQGGDSCKRCGAKPTPIKLVALSGAFVLVGAPVAVFGYLLCKGMLESSGGVIKLLILVPALAGIAAGAGLIDLGRGLFALATGQKEVRALTTKAVMDYVEGVGS